MLQKNKFCKKLHIFFYIALLCCQQYVLAMGTSPKPKKETPDQTQITETTHLEIIPQAPAPIPVDPTPTELDQDPKIETAQTEPEAPSIVTQPNTKPVESEIQIRSDIKEQLRWLLMPESSQTTEQYVLIKLNVGETVATIDAQTNTKNFIYIDPSRPENALDNGLFLWKKDEQVIETAWGELYLLRTKPESIFTCAFKAPDEDSAGDSDSLENIAPETHDKNSEENIKSPTPQPDKAWDNKYCIFREKDGLWQWEEPIDIAQQKYPVFDTEIKATQAKKPDLPATDTASTSTQTNITTDVLTTNTQAKALTE